MAVHDQAIPVGDLHPADLRLTSINLFAVSPVIIGDLLLPILALIAKWFLVIIIGVILIRLQPTV